MSRLHHIRNDGAERLDFGIGHAFEFDHRKGTRLIDTIVQYDERECYVPIRLTLSHRGLHEGFIDLARGARYRADAAGDAGVRNVVLVHGAFADGSGWRPVATILEGDGYTVYVVQEPLTSWDADLAATRSVLDRAGPCVLVAHSWGGLIITE